MAVDGMKQQVARLEKKCALKKYHFRTAENSAIFKLLLGRCCDISREKLHLNVDRTKPIWGLKIIAENLDFF